MGAGVGGIGGVFMAGILQGINLIQEQIAGLYNGPEQVITIELAYETLNLIDNPNLTKQQVDQAYRQLAVAFHPDNERALGGEYHVQLNTELFAFVTSCRALIYEQRGWQVPQN